MAVVLVAVAVVLVAAEVVAARRWWRRIVVSQTLSTVPLFETHEQLANSELIRHAFSLSVPDYLIQLAIFYVRSSY